MNDVKTIIKYDGPALEEKKMDVSDLAPSLLSLSELIKDANRTFNGNRAGIKVYVNADLEQNCFELIVHVTQTIFDQMTVLISENKVKQAKEILEWIGIIGGITSPITLYKLIKVLNGKTVESVSKVKMGDSEFGIQITVIGDNNRVENINVSEPVYKLYSSYLTRKRAIEVLAPLKREGYDKIKFYKGKKVYEEFTRMDVPEIEACPEVVPSNITHSDIKTTVRIKKPAYEGKSKWTLIYEKSIEASIDDEQWLSDFQSNKISAPPNCILEVDMIKEVIVNEHGEAIDEPVYRVTKVHRVIPYPDQMNVFCRKI